MLPDLRIELPDEAHAESLRASLLQSYDVETVPVDGYVELRIGLLDFSPERRIVGALNAIDSWLVGADLDSICVHLDGKSYTLHTPPRVEA
jgi:hypothetical protein